MKNLIILVVVILIGGGGYYYMSMNSAPFGATKSAPLGVESAYKKRIDILGFKEKSREKGRVPKVNGIFTKITYVTTTDADKPFNEEILLAVDSQKRVRFVAVEFLAKDLSGIRLTKAHKFVLEIWAMVTKKKPSELMETITIGKGRSKYHKNVAKAKNTNLTAQWTKADEMSNEVQVFATVKGSKGKKNSKDNNQKLGVPTKEELGVETADVQKLTVRQRLIKQSIKQYRALLKEKKKIEIRFATLMKSKTSAKSEEELAIIKNEIQTIVKRSELMNLEAAKSKIMLSDGMIDKLRDEKVPEKK